MNKTRSLMKCGMFVIVLISMLLGSSAYSQILPNISKTIYLPGESPADAREFIISAPAGTYVQGNPSEGPDIITPSGFCGITAEPLPPVIYHYEILNDTGQTIIITGLIDNVGTPDNTSDDLNFLNSDRPATDCNGDPFPAGSTVTLLDGESLCWNYEIQHDVTAINESNCQIVNRISCNFSSGGITNSISDTADIILINVCPPPNQNYDCLSWAADPDLNVYPDLAAAALACENDVLLANALFGSPKAVSCCNQQLTLPVPGDLPTDPCTQVYVRKWETFTSQCNTGKTYITPSDQEIVYVDLPATGFGPAPSLTPVPYCEKDLFDPPSLSYVKCGITYPVEPTVIPNHPCEGGSYLVVWDPGDVACSPDLTPIETTVPGDPIPPFNWATPTPTDEILDECATPPTSPYPQMFVEGGCLPDGVSIPVDPVPTGEITLCEGGVIEISWNWTYEEEDELKPECGELSHTIMISKPPFPTPTWVDEAPPDAELPECTNPNDVTAPDLTAEYDCHTLTEVSATPLVEGDKCNGYKITFTWPAPDDPCYPLEDQVQIVTIPGRLPLICGTKFIDEDCDGVGDSPMSDITVNLLDADMQLITSKVIIDGEFCFEVSPGVYYIQLDEGGIIGYIPTAGVLRGPINVTEDDCCGPPIELEPFLNSPLASLGDYVWEDLNVDGIQDPGEPGIPGVTVNLWICEDDAPSSIIATAVTDGNGKYLFTGLMPGDYAVQFVAPTDYMFTLQNQGADDAKDSDPDPANGIVACLNLAACEINLTVDAGLYKPVGDQGCTPGYWKNQPECWACTPYTPDTLVSSVFVLGPCVDDDLSGSKTKGKEGPDGKPDTLMDALNYGGGSGIEGKARNLLRAAVAALLNASCDKVAYPRLEGDVIADVNMAFAACDTGKMSILQGDLDADNNLGCGMDAHCREKMDNEED